MRSSLWYTCAMLNLWRRHMKSCPHRLRTHKKCGCPICVQGTLHGKWLKKSLDLRNWESAQKLVRDWESGHSKGAEHSSVPKACDAFIRDCEARNLSGASLGKYRLLTNELKEEFGERADIVVIPNASHALIPEQPAAVIDAIVTWIGKLPTP